MFKDGWRYSDGGFFRERFPEWTYDSDGKCWCLIVECAELVDGRWEGFVSIPGVYVEDEHNG